MFIGPDVERLAMLLREQNARLHHACQLIDFRSYLALRGVPSRMRLEQSGLAFTRFRSDSTDKAVGVWHLVFLNLEDFTQRWFANGVQGTPNPYGPVLLEFAPEALTEFSEVAVCLRSASGSDFDRETESLNNLADVRKLFRRPGAPQVLDRWGLQAAFPDRNPDDVRSVELSCSASRGVLSFQYLRLVRVDPYDVDGVPLINFVEEAAREAQLRLPIYERDFFAEDQRLVMQALGQALIEYAATLDDLARPPATAISSWAEAMRQRRLDGYFADYAGYLRQGTLLPAAEQLEDGIEYSDETCQHLYARALDSDFCPECGEVVLGR